MELKSQKKLLPTVCDRLKVIQTIRENYKERFTFKGYGVIRIYNKLKYLKVLGLIFNK